MKAVLRGENFILRPFRKGDEESLVRNINNEKIYRPTLRIPYPYTMNDAKKWIEECEKNDKEKENPNAVNFAIDANGEVVGGIGLSKIVKQHKGELGYWLSENYWGKGIMTEAIKLIIEFGFKQLKLVRIYADVFPFNKASMKVLEKNGFKLEGILRKNTLKDGKYIDDYRFAKVL